MQRGAGSISYADQPGFFATFSRNSPQTIRNMLYRILLFLTLSLTLHTASAHPAWGIVADATGTLFFADIGHHGRGAVWMLKPDGSRRLLLRDFHAHNVSRDADGHLLTAHGEDNHTLLRLRFPGPEIDTIYHTHDFKEFFGGNCTYSPDGRILFQIDHYFWTIDSSGQKRKLSDHYFEWNQTIFADAEGFVYGPDIGVGNGVVMRIHPDGRADTLAKDLLTRTDPPADKHDAVLLGMAKDTEGRLYIAELVGKRIIQIGENGAKKTYYSSNGNWFPTGLTFVDETAYILEFNRDGNSGPRIVRFENGNATEHYNHDSYQPPSPIAVLTTDGSISPLWFGLGGFVLALVLILTVYRRVWRGKNG